MCLWPFALNSAPPRSMSTTLLLSNSASDDIIAPKTTVGGVRDCARCNIKLTYYRIEMACSRMSALMPAALMIGRHFCKAASPSEVCCSRGKTSNPGSASRVRTAASASGSTAAALSLPIISFEVPLGAKSHCHADHKPPAAPFRQNRVVGSEGPIGACADGRGALVANTARW